MIDKKRILAVVKKAEAWYEILGTGKVDWPTHDKACNAIQAEVDAINKEVGNQLAPGKLLQFGVADGSAQYIVIKVGKRETEVAHLPLGDAYHFQGMYITASGRLVCPTPVALLYSRI